MAPPSRIGVDPSPFADIALPEHVDIKVHDQWIVPVPCASLTGADLMHLLDMSPLEAAQRMLRPVDFDRLIEAWNSLDGFVDDATFIDLVAIPVEMACGIPSQTAMALAQAAKLYWPAVQQTAGWHADVGAMPARRFCMCVIVALNEPKTTETSERIAAYVSRLVRDVDNAKPVIRRKRRRRRRTDNTGATGNQ